MNSTLPVDVKIIKIKLRLNGRDICFTFYLLFFVSRIYIFICSLKIKLDGCVTILTTKRNNCMKYFCNSPNLEE